MRIATTMKLDAELREKADKASKKMFMSRTAFYEMSVRKMLEKVKKPSLRERTLD